MFLGVARNELINQRFRKFIVPESVGKWDSHITSTFSHVVKHDCDLLLSRIDGYTFDVHLESYRYESPRFENNPLEFVVRTTITDITERKNMEIDVRKRLDELEKSIIEKQERIIELEKEVEGLKKS